MHNARHHRAVFLPNRQNIAIRAHGDDGILQIFLEIWVVNHAVQPLANTFIARAHLAADLKQLVARAIRDFILADDRVGNGLLDGLERRKPRGIRAHQRRILPITMASRAARAARRLAPISINARGERDEPICARCSEACTSENESIGVPPK